MSVILSEIVPNRVLIVRLGAIRDGLMTIPLAVDAKRLWPDSHLSWIVDGEIEHFLQDHPSVDDVIRIERNWLRSPQCWQAIKGRLRERNFDVVLDPQSVLKSVLLGRMSKCKIQLGFDRPQAREFASHFLTHKIKPTVRHRVDVYRQLLQPWRETESGNGEFLLPINSTVRHLVSKSLETCVGSTKNWVAIYPGALWPTAVWPHERFAAIAKYMLDYFQMPSIVLWRDSHEKLLGKVIVEQGQPAARLAPELDALALAEICRQAKFVIASDSDILQIASAVGTPCLSLHGPTWADEFGGYKHRRFAIQSPYPLVSKRRVRRGANSAMQAIELEEVQQAIERLMRGQAHSKAA